MDLGHLSPWWWAVQLNRHNASLIIPVHHISTFLFYFHFYFLQLTLFPHIALEDWYFFHWWLLLTETSHINRASRNKKPFLVGWLISTSRLHHLISASVFLLSSPCFALNTLTHTLVYRGLLCHIKLGTSIWLSWARVAAGAFQCRTWVGGAGGCVWLCRGCSVPLGDTMECLFTLESCGLILIFIVFIASL